MSDEPLQQKLTTEELEGWVPAAQALREASRVISPYTTARAALVRRLMGEQIRSGAEGYSAGKEKGGVVEIGGSFWGLVEYTNRTSKAGSH